MFAEVLMPPLCKIIVICFFHIYSRKENNPASIVEGTMLAIGGRYDYLLHQIWTSDYQSIHLGTVGVNLTL